MPPVVRDAASSAAKWSRNAGGAGQSYAEGVQAPRRDWAQATVQAKGSYNAGLAESQGKNRWEKGVTKAGTGKQKERSLTVGVSRFSQGVAAAVDQYQAGVTPYLEVIRSVTLPARGPKGAPQNIQRVSAIATALRAKKESL